MRNLLSLTLALLLVAGSVGLADAGGHRGSHRVGGYNSNGKGSHYEGGIGSYGRKPREHHPRRLKSCTERHPCIKVHRLVVAPVVIAPAFVTPTTGTRRADPTTGTRRRLDNPPDNPHRRNSCNGGFPGFPAVARARRPRQIHCKHPNAAVARARRPREIHCKYPDPAVARARRPRQIHCRHPDPLDCWENACALFALASHPAESRSTWKARSFWPRSCRRRHDLGCA